MFCRRILPILSSPWPQSVKGLVPRHSQTVPKAGTEFAQNNMTAATPNGALAGYVVAVSNRWNQRHVEKPHQMHLGTQPPCHAKHEFTCISRQCHHNIFRLMSVGMFFAQTATLAGRRKASTNRIQEAAFWPSRASPSTEGNPEQRREAQVLQVR